ncbi:hypothetical protein PHYBLDRAFT_71389 [Phycomyces blakesleeanus NRRL 1555(-)]|uniref:Uncharacterized protein n=1 Tax=Phycomyces blakesleeanus (strain ATCC 8743b / DSM 1359 / FGSC 10004 / NBRC 33097 / NRRL 1555) TaxID=763407 RepID=A0A167MX07_PHYB8|nr:hypothetical protein PHYBLDRAFT_71389 [Phycomyces blakesleeanus NRRL 1555(-)]OAD74349.1 hypothetical protein PHYBLDRAFT_71389 [Phycomyces blakesleeanus NRRL 1555(-)]|eukprot:XP_018292389.1 hypothetical protein PHYBLDRAFT_71389 [Phycomyces blakesleeanus NRRL 1555(-)]
MTKNNPKMEHSPLTTCEIKKSDILVPYIKGKNHAKILPQFSGTKISSLLQCVPRSYVINWQLFHLFRILEQTLTGHCFLKRIKTGCVSIIPSYSETMESILPDATETGHQLQGLASSEEGVRSENTLVSSYLVGILASTIHE